MYPLCFSGLLVRRLFSNGLKLFLLYIRVDKLSSFEEECVFFSVGELYRVHEELTPNVV